jgi:predicted nucleic acid-binding protein
VSRRSPKFVLDAHLFIDAFRDPAAKEALQRFHYTCAPFEYFSVVVAQELRAGIKRPGERDALERHVLSVFERSGRIITPSARAWHRSGDVLAAMGQQEALQLTRVSKAFVNDVLLAISCSEAGCVLVTNNERDFARIRKFAEFDFVKPWPA